MSPTYAEPRTLPHDTMPWQRTITYSAPCFTCVRILLRPYSKGAGLVGSMCPRLWIWTGWAARTASTNSGTAINKTRAGIAYPFS